MKYIEYKEHRDHGSVSFPMAYYHVTPMHPRYKMLLHWHPYWEIIHISKGSMTMTINQNLLHFVEDDIIFLPGGVLHGGTPDNCIYDCMVFDLNFFLNGKNNHFKGVRELLDQKYQVNTNLGRGQKGITELVKNIFTSLSRHETCYEMIVQGGLYTLAGLILNRGLYHEVEESSVSGSQMNSIKAVLSHISDHYDENVTLDELAKVAGMNPKYFCRFFKNMTDRTPIDYLNYYRIESACELLSTKDMAIKEVALSCGFNDQSYFVKTFRKYKGVTPTQFMHMTFS